MNIARILHFFLVGAAIVLLWNASADVARIAPLYEQHDRTLHNRPAYPFHNFAAPNFHATQAPSYYLNTSGQGIQVARSLALSVTRNTPFAPVEPSSTACQPDAMTRAVTTLRAVVDGHSLAVTGEQIDGSDACTTNGVAMTIAVPTPQLDSVAVEIEQVLLALENGKPSTTTTAAAENIASHSPTHVTEKADRDGAMATLRNSVFVRELGESSGAVVGPLEVSREVSRRRYLRYHAVVYQEDLDSVLAPRPAAEGDNGEEADDESTMDFAAWSKKHQSDKQLNVSRAMVFLDGLRDVETKLVTVEHELKRAQERLESLTATLEVRLVDRDIRSWKDDQRRELERIEKTIVKRWVMVSAQVGGAVVGMIAAYCLSRKAKRISDSEFDEPSK